MSYALVMQTSPLDADLEAIRTLFLQMCVRAEAMVQRSVRSVLDRDPHMGRAVMDADKALDALEVEIDGRCVRCLALRRPEGIELRMVTTVLKMVTDLERIGDLAVNIAERGLEVGTGPGLEPGRALAEMGSRAVDMVRLASNAFVAEDSEVLSVLLSYDEELDQLNRSAFKYWLKVMAEHPDQSDRALCFTSISRHLERIGDHAVNLGQMLVLLVEGRDVRHAR